MDGWMVGREVMALIESRMWNEEEKLIEVEWEEIEREFLCNVYGYILSLSLRISANGYA